MKQLVLIAALTLSTFVSAQEKNVNSSTEVATSSKLLIDVRTPEEFNEGTINDAINIDFYNENFKENISKFNRDIEIIVFCKAGGRSEEALEVFKDLGFSNVKQLEGGYDKYIEDATE